MSGEDTVTRINQRLADELSRSEAEIDRLRAGIDAAIWNLSADRGHSDPGGIRQEVADDLSALSATWRCGSCHQAHPQSSARWCAAGCGSDFREMTKDES